MSSRSVALMATLAIAVVSCAAVTASDTTDPTVTTVSSSTTVETVPTTGTAAPTTSPTSTTTTVVIEPANGEPVGVFTPTGVPVAVLEIGTDGYTVLTPCGNTAEVLSGDPIHDVRVVLDPGHGGPIDTGAVAPTGMPEKDLNLRVARSAQHLLEERGISTVLTRTYDYAVPLGVRAQFADRLGANVMVSIHHNAPTTNPSEQPGVEVFVQSRSPESRRLGGILWEESMDSLSGFDVEWSSAPDAGVMTVLNTRGSDAYGIIRGPETPTALIELGYISNRPEAELHQTAQYVPTAAQSVADAIERYLITDDSGSGFVESRTFNPQPGVGSGVCVEPDLG